ncbi:MAG: hypothetical protein ACRDLY_01725, partial [Thermoleophilaceae bacterium]
MLSTLARAAGAGRLTLPARPEFIVIRPEQLAQALDRIHPRDRELLSLSLRRRVPDEALARLYECESTDVA